MMDPIVPDTGGKEQRVNPSDQDLIRVVNQNFYNALESRDLGLMRQAWADSDAIRCVHPGWELLTGTSAVMKSFRAIFGVTEGLRISLSDPDIQIEGDIAVVHLVEKVLSRRGNGPNTFCEMQATNIFKKTDGRWRMILHHASPFERRMTPPPSSQN